MTQQEYEWEEKYERNQAVVKRVEEGIAFTKVAKEFGISKQRVGQIYERNKPKHRELIPLNEYCKLSGVNRDMAISNIKYGSLKGKLIGHRYYVEKEELNK